MLFNSYEFLFLFFPVCIIGFYLLFFSKGQEWAIGWLVILSLIFYGWWKPPYLILLIVSITFNYGISRLLASPKYSEPIRKAIIVFGVSANLLTLSYFKYANFFIGNVGSLFGAHWALGEIILPLGISFFTFQKIGYIVDTYKRRMEPHGPLHYALFVSFFPQLIAGPLVHHNDVIPQFTARWRKEIPWLKISAGLLLFSIGIFKKVLIADPLGELASAVYATADSGRLTGWIDAWSGSLAYMFQIYFDFSGYSDMAIGLAWLFGINLPLNFNSPYKAHSIIEFWRRWHMTLTKFLRDYLYIPLGGNRKGKLRTRINLVATMLLSGLWHGAGWTFVLWGGLHAVYLVINHSWRDFGFKMPPLLGWIITFLSVNFAWVLFRAKTLTAAIIVYREMFHFTPDAGQMATSLQFFYVALGFIISVFGISASATLAERVRLGLWQAPAWLPAATAALLVFAILNLHKVSEFIYFNF